jgi:hypothetical protein
MMAKSKQALDGPIIHVEKHVAIYKIVGSPYYRARIWIPIKKRRLVRSTKCSSRIEAMKAAKEYAAELSSMNMKPEVPKIMTFEHFADQLITAQGLLVKQKRRHPQQQKNDKYRLYDEDSGLVPYFKGVDVRTITTRSYLEYIDFLRKKRPTIIASSTFNHITSCFRKVLKGALQAGVINQIPDTPRPERKELPRSYFRFYPLVPADQDEYEKILETAKQEALEPNGDIPVSKELYEFILWQAHTFMRPTLSEAFGVRFKDVTIVNDQKAKQKHLLIRVKGKTGFRTVVSMPAAVTVFNRLNKRKHLPSDFLFMPHVKNRTNASNYMGRMFKHVIKKAEIFPDELAAGKYTLYSLRHTSICMRLVLSKGKINIFTLAKNAGTSVEQIQRFYANQLPIAEDLIKNLQSFGE